MTQIFSEEKENWFDWKWHLASMVGAISLIKLEGHKL